MKKVCYKCKEEKELVLFGAKKKSPDGRRNMCKKCLNEISKVYNKKNRQKNKIKIAERDKKYREKNKDKIKAYHKVYGKLNSEKLKERAKIKYQKNKEQRKKYGEIYRKKNKEIIKKRNKIYQEKNKDKIKIRIKKNRVKINKNRRERYQNNIPFKLRIAISNNIKNNFKRHKSYKNNKTEKIIGCSFKFFKTYIESKFESWMNWNNHGKYNGQVNFGWDLDHIIPISSANSKEDIIKLSHYTNFQPLCSKVNRHEKRNNLNFSQNNIS